MRNKKLSILEMKKMKKERRKLAWVTAYDFPLALAAETAGIDMILVGDSGGMVQLGYTTTNPVTMDEMISFSQAVRRGASNSFIVGDMPQGSYEVSNEEAVRSFMRFSKEAGVDAVKLEGGKRVCNRVKAIVDAGGLVIGHLGLTPQSSTSFGGYRVQGKTLESYEALLEDALALQKAGACALLLEAIPEEPASQISQQLKIPVYGIGAGGKVDGQLLIMHDLLGFYSSFRPWFAKCYIPNVIDKFSDFLKAENKLGIVEKRDTKDGLLTLSQMAIAEYVKEVHNNSFPNTDYVYPIKTEQLETLTRSHHWHCGDIS